MSLLTLAERLARGNVQNELAPSELSRSGTATSRQGSEDPVSSPSETITTRPSAVRKRRSDEEATYNASHVAQKLKLGPKDKTALIQCAKSSDRQRELYNIGIGLKILGKLNTIQPVEAKFVIGSALNSKIEVYTTNAMLCPTTTGYIADSARVVMSILMRHPSWGLTGEVKNNEQHLKVIQSRVGTRLTDKRREFKVVIMGSLGTIDEASTDSDSGSVVRTGSMDIITLVKTLGKVRGDTAWRTENITLTLQMLGRIAFLRQVYVECEKDNKASGAGADYWKVVDRKLVEIREAYAGKPRALESQFFKGILDDDLATYGENTKLDIDDLNPSDMARPQQEIEDAMTGVVTVLTEDEDEETIDDDGEE